MRFQYLKHSLQKRMVCHRNQLCEIIIKLWQGGYPYSRIVDTIIDFAYQAKKFHKINSVETIKKIGWPGSVRTSNLRRSTKAKAKKGASKIAL